MAEATAPEDFDPATSPLTLETLKGRTIEGYCGGVFGRDSYGDKTVIAFGEHGGGYFIGVALGFESGLRIAGPLTEAQVREFLAPDPDAIDWK